MRARREHDRAVRWPDGTAARPLQLPPYDRMDIRVTRTFQVGNGRLSAFVDVFNLYNRENLRSNDYKVELPSGMSFARRKHMKRASSTT
jgi:hypothetical protein